MYPSVFLASTISLFLYLNRPKERKRAYIYKYIVCVKWILRARDAVPSCRQRIPGSTERSHRDKPISDSCIKHRMCRPWELKLLKELIPILITAEVQLIIARFRGEIDEYSVAEWNDLWPRLLALLLIIFLHIAFIISRGGAAPLRAPLIWFVSRNTKRKQKNSWK